MGVSGGIFLGGQAISFPIFVKLGDVKKLMCICSLIKGSVHFKYKLCSKLPDECVDMAADIYKVI